MLASSNALRRGVRGMATLLVLHCITLGIHAVMQCPCACRCQASDGSSSRNSGKPLEASARRPYKRMQMRPETGSSAEEDKRSQQAASAPDSVPSVGDSASWEQWKEVGCRDGRILFVRQL